MVVYGAGNAEEIWCLLVCVNRANWGNVPWRAVGWKQNCGVKAFGGGGIGEAMMGLGGVRIGGGVGGKAGDGDGFQKRYARVKTPYWG